jgi:glyoxylase-like metal-dependent hydrolase (beta-lactamase superfamily II)
VLVETTAGLVLVDTGYGLRDVAAPLERLSRFFLRLLDPGLREERTAVRQIEALGFAAGDVRHIVLTHLDFDRAGGLDDFPGATVHLMHAETEDAFAQRTWLDRQRYRPQQWSSRDRWLGYTGAGEPWFGFTAVRELRGLPPEILLVPLRGHTLGHAGVAIQHDHGWLLVAGDAYVDHAELDAVAPGCPPALRCYQWLMETDRGARLRNQRRLRALVRDHGDRVRVVCSHDPSELGLQGVRPLDVPPGGQRSIRIDSASTR